MAEIKSAYLDTACVGKVHSSVAARAHEIIGMFQEFDGDPTEFTSELYNQFEKGRSFIADVLGVNDETICFIESTSHGLGMIANSLPLVKEDNVLICDLEFLSTSLCWKRHAEKVGFEIRPVPTTSGRVTLADFQKVADKNTKAIVVSSVQEINGYRVDLEAFSLFARKIGAYLLVDGIQEAGALNSRLGQVDIDVYCAGGHKWLGNPFGMGFMYINKKNLPVLEPDFYSYFNVKDPPGGWGAYLESPRRTPFDDLIITSDASKFETGATPNFIGAFALEKAFETIKNLGIDSIEKEVLARRRYLQERLMQAKVCINGSIEENTLSGICTFNLREGIEAEKELMKFFKEKHICCSLRYISGIGGIRLSTHYYTSYEEIDYLIETLENYLSKKF